MTPGMQFPDPDASCALFNAHVRNVICRGDKAKADYFFDWLALVVQRLNSKPNVALWLNGEKRAGKGLCCKYVSRLFEPRFVNSPSVTDLTRKFASHLASCKLLLVDEATFAISQEASAVMKTIISEKMITVRRKYVAAFEMPLVTAVIACTNMNIDRINKFHPGLRRRTAAFDVSNEKVGDTGYFTALAAEMMSGGPARLMYDCLSRDITSFDEKKLPFSLIIKSMQYLQNYLPTNNATE